MTTVTHPARIIRLPQVRSRTGLSRSTIYEHISRGRFPKQIRLGPKSVGWLEHDNERWIGERVSASRGAAH